MPLFNDIFERSIDHDGTHMDVLVGGSRGKSDGFVLLQSGRLKGCGANGPDGGGFQAGNTCASGGGSLNIDKLKQDHRLQTLRVSESDDHIELDMIKVSPENRGEGKATAAVKELIAHAETKGVPIVLTAEAMEDGKQKDIERFYERLGFERPGSNKDFSLPRHTHILNPKPVDETNKTFEVSGEQLKTGKPVDV